MGGFKMLNVKVQKLDITKNIYNELTLSGVNDLGINSTIKITLNSVMANAFRITLKMIHPYAEQVLPPTDSATCELSCDATYYDDMEAIANGGKSMKLYLGGKSINIIIPLKTKIEMPNEDYKPWYESKTILSASIDPSSSSIESLQGKLDKLFPFEQSSPVNEPCYKYIKS